MTDTVEVDAGSTTDATSRGRTDLDSEKSSMDAKPENNDPRVADILTALDGDTKKSNDKSQEDLEGGGKAATNIEEEDASRSGDVSSIAPASMAPSSQTSSLPTATAPQLSPMALTQNVQPTLPSLLAGLAPMATSALSAPAALTSAVTPVASQVALTPSQQQALLTALNDGSSSSSSSSDPSKPGLTLEGAGNLADLTRNLVSADIPYAWGGGDLEGPTKGISDGGGAADAHGDYNKTGFDCSGLSRYVHFQLTGDEVPRTSEAQYAAGQEVSSDQAQPGDFVFPNSSFGGSGPGHVQIYLGEGKVLEAPQSGDKVRISEMTPSVIKRF